ncbi:putative ABC transporter ATP-binding protein YheS [Leucobacter soli]|uniref:ABC transporter ATP-binding protein YheS n=1 Tax=Leucobacter soli TaxID=2812850 RepID=A0A916K045_9MICO|nr:putative ABC transporter ATP-binding protein YheS [Leucobacter soli]
MPFGTAPAPASTTTHSSTAAPSSAAPKPSAASRAAALDTGATTRSHLSVDGVSLAYGDRRVLTDVSFSARNGERLGLIGENGTGKSSLLRVIAGVQRPDAGGITAPGSVALLEQRLPYPDAATVAEVLDDAQRPALDALARLESAAARLSARPDDAAAGEDYADALEAAERDGAWTAESSRGDALSGLGLGGIPGARAIGRLSGGQRLRLALAAVLLRAPHTLLLDEPSNHLDDASAAYLERVLREWPGIVIFASHDRALLDAAATGILDLDQSPVPASVLGESGEAAEDTGSGLGIRHWGVGYSAARAARAEEMRRWRQRYEAELSERESLDHEIRVGAHEVNRKHESKSESRITRKFYADKDARVTARRARNARVRLETLERERVRRPPEPLRFRGFDGGDPVQADIAPGPLGPPGTPDADAPLLIADRVAIPERIPETSLELRAGGRILLSGPNGAGKSTLLAILAGELEPESGTVERAARTGYLPQEVEFEDLSQSAEASYRDLVGVEIAECAPLETLGLISPRDLSKPTGELSIGQARRLALAVLAADAPPVLLLDEPTNHLSLTLVEELGDALEAYSGALIVASHDRWLRSRWRGEELRLG